MLNKPVSELNLSVRARKCMNRLGITTLGELVHRTADELLEAKNFGMTSLTEVREKLTTMGLKVPRRLIFQPSSTFHNNSYFLRGGGASTMPAPT